MARGHVRREYRFREIEFWPQDGHVVMFDRATGDHRIFSVEQAVERAREFYETAKNMDGPRRSEYMRAARRLLEVANYAASQRNIIRSRSIMFRTKSGLIVPASAIRSDQSK